MGTVLVFMGWIGICAAVDRALKKKKAREAQRRAEREAQAKEDEELLRRAQAEAEARKKAQMEAAYRAQQEAARQADATSRAEAEARATAEMTKKENVFKRYYKRNGINQLSIISAGYSTYFCYNTAIAAKPTQTAFQNHLLSVQILEWRAKCFGMQMFNFEFDPAHVSKTMWFAYKPAIKFYIPCCNWMAIELYGGVELDMCKAWNMINSKYYEKTYNTAGTPTAQVPEDNWFLAPYGGIGFMFTPTPYLPIELKAEYRHPLQGNMNLIPQGIYISAQLHIAAPTKKR